MLPASRIMYPLPIIPPSLRSDSNFEGQLPGPRIPDFPNAPTSGSTAVIDAITGYKPGPFPYQPLPITQR